MAGKATTAAARKRAEQDNGYLDADQIVEVDDLGEADVDVPEWGGKVRVKALSQRAGTELMKEAGASRENGGVIEDIPAWHRLLIREGCIQPKFTQAKVEKLADKAGAPVYRIAQAVGALSALPVDADGTVGVSDDLGNG